MLSDLHACEVSIPQNGLSKLNLFEAAMFQLLSEGYSRADISKYTVGVIKKFPYRLRSVCVPFCVGFALGLRRVCVGLPFHVLPVYRLTTVLSNYTLS